MGIKSKEFFDGIAFYKDDIEVAFYSNITQLVCYYDNMYGIVALPISDAIVIHNLIKEYIKKGAHNNADGQDIS